MKMEEAFARWRRNLAKEEAARDSKALDDDTRHTITFTEKRLVKIENVILPERRERCLQLGKYDIAWRMIKGEQRRGFFALPRSEAIEEGMPHEERKCTTPLLSDTYAIAAPKTRRQLLVPVLVCDRKVPMHRQLTSAKRFAVKACGKTSLCPQESDLRYKLTLRLRERRTRCHEAPIEEYPDTSAPSGPSVSTPAELRKWPVQLVVSTGLLKVYRLVDKIPESVLLIEREDEAKMVWLSATCAVQMISAHGEEIVPNAVVVWLGLYRTCRNRSYFASDYDQVIEYILRLHHGEPAQLEDQVTVWERALSVLTRNPIKSHELLLLEMPLADLTRRARSDQSSPTV